MTDSASMRRRARVFLKALFVPARALPTLAILLYFCGWQYVNEYFAQFGVRASFYELDEYAYFLYTVNVLLALPTLVVSQFYMVALAVVALVVGLTSPYWIRVFSSVYPRLSLMRLSIWTTLLVALFILGQAAGREDAKAVLAGEARQTNVFFTKDASAHFADNLKEGEAEQRFEAIRRASELGGIALIWRSSSESIFLQFGTQGDHHGKPLEIFRINNSHVFMTVSRPNN